VGPALGGFRHCATLRFPVLDPEGFGFRRTPRQLETSLPGRAQARDSHATGGSAETVDNITRWIRSSINRLRFYAMMSLNVP
jgi:hypothetical protein